MLYAPFIVLGYLCGSVTFGYWLILWLKGVDIRTVGSHNLGATNVLRTFGWRWGVPVMLLDILKAFGPTLAATLVVGHLCGVLTGAAAMVGHARPVFLKFAKGGKMVATAGGAFLGVAPLLGLAGVGVWILLFVVTRYASVSSILAAASLAPLAYGLGYPWPVIAFGGAAGVGVLALHRANVRRLWAGEENRIDLRRGKPGRPGTEMPVSR